MLLTFWIGLHVVGVNGALHMMSTAKQFLIPLLLFLLVACSSETAQQPPVTPAQTAQPEMASGPATHTAQPVTASPSAPPIAATATVEAPADPAQSESGSPTQSATPEMEASATATVESVTSSGRSADGAYFLGRDDARLKIIDYSDFL